MTLCQRDNDRGELRHHEVTMRGGRTNRDAVPARRSGLCDRAARSERHTRDLSLFDTIESYHRLMIALSLIVEAALVTGLAVTIAAFAKGWTFRCAMLAAIGTFLLIIAWRALANVFALNADFMPAISVGDSGCLIAGALIPYLVGRSACIATGARILPAVVGGLVGFLVNVVIL